jgi:hypothetical protein
MSICLAIVWFVSQGDIAMGMNAVLLSIGINTIALALE